MCEEIVGLSLWGEGKVSAPTVSTLQSARLVCRANLIIRAGDTSDGHVYPPDPVASQREAAGGGGPLANFLKCFLESAGPLSPLLLLD